jgi:hypothetical protein
MLAPAAAAVTVLQTMGDQMVPLASSQRDVPVVFHKESGDWMFF